MLVTFRQPASGLEATSSKGAWAAERAASSAPQPSQLVPSQGCDAPEDATDEDEDVEKPSKLVTEAEGVKLHLSSKSSTGYMCIQRKNNGRFEARTRHHPRESRKYDRERGDTKRLGTFDTAVEAALAYARHRMANGDGSLEEDEGSMHPEVVLEGSLVLGCDAPEEAKDEDKMVVDQPSRPDHPRPKPSKPPHTAPAAAAAAQPESTASSPPTSEEQEGRFSSVERICGGAPPKDAMAPATIEQPAAADNAPAGGGVNPPRRAQASVDEERINNVLGGLVTRVGGPPQRTAAMMVTHMFAPTLVEAAERGLLKDDRATPVAPVASAAPAAQRSSSSLKRPPPLECVPHRSFDTPCGESDLSSDKEKAPITTRIPLQRVSLSGGQ